MDDRLVDWSKIKPTVWHKRATDTRLYLYLSPSGKTHVAKWTGNIRTTYGHLRDRDNYEFLTLCNRRFTENDPVTTKRTGWRRPSVFWNIHNREPDRFLGIDCGRCKKLTPKFIEPTFEIDLRLHESELLLTEGDDRRNHNQEVPHFYKDSRLTGNIIPEVLRDPKQRCNTCDKVCTPSEIERRHREIVSSFHGGWRNPDGCDDWQAGVYAERQEALRLTDEQLRKLSLYRLQLIYDYHITSTWDHDKDMSFLGRILKAIEEKEE